MIQIGSTTYFIIGSNLYKRNNDSFNLVGKLSDDLKFLNVGWGRNENDIFIGMRDGIAHYNGENTVYLYKSSENIFIRKGIIFNNEVFFLAHGSGVNIIIHVILNDKL